MPMCQQRDIYFDLVKAVAIFLVVLGHVKATSHLNFIPLENFIVGANMPLFFILSGWFAYPTITNCDTRRVIKHLRSYLQPVLTTAVVFAVLSACCGTVSWNIMEIGVHAIKRILFATWFLWALSIIYLICFGGALIIKRFNWLCVGIALLFGVLLFVPRVWQIHSIRHMMPYFIIGMAFRHYNIRPWITSFGCCCLALYMAFIILEGNVRENNMGFYWADSSWKGIFLGWYDLVTFVARNVVGVIGAVGIMWGVDKLKEDLPSRHLIALVGRYTICVYLMHSWMIERLYSTCPAIFSSWFHMVLVSLALTIGCATFGWLTIEKSQVFRCIFWGR